MWRDKNSWDIFSLLVGGRHEISSESGVWEREICKFYVEADVVDGKVLRYSFSSLVEDIRRTCGSLRHHTSSTLRIRYKDEDGDFVNLKSYKSVQKGGTLPLGRL